MKKNSNFKWKALGLILVFALEMGYAGTLMLKEDEPAMVRTYSTLPVLGDWYYERHIRPVRRNAEMGNVSDMIYLHDEARFLNRPEDQAAALEMIRSSNSAAADLFLFLLEGATDEQMGQESYDAEREFMLLHARVMRENLRPPGLDIRGEKFIQQSKRYARSLAILLENAESGDETANWIIRNLYR